MSQTQLEKLMLDILKKYLTPEQKARLIRLKLSKKGN